MRPEGNSRNNIVSLDAKRREKHGLSEPTDLDHERQERHKWPKMKRTTAAALIGASSVLAALGMGQAHEQQTRQDLFNERATEMQAERNSLTLEEAIRHAQTEAESIADQKSEFVKSQRPDELTASGVSSTRNGSETAVNAPIEISSTSLAHDANHQEAKAQSPSGREVGRMAGEIQSRDD